MHNVRDQFPYLQREVNGHPFIYLDSAATSQKPKSVIDCVTKFYSNEYATVHRAIYCAAAYATHKYQETRKKVQTFLNAKSDEEIIFTKGTTEGINLVAHSFGKANIKPGDSILISEMEHHSNIVPWQLCAAERGAKLHIIPFLDSGELDMIAYRKLLELKPKMVAIAHVSNTLGIVNPIREIVEAAHKAGAVVLVDGAQSTPHMPIDVQAMTCDFFVFSGHKLFGPSGVGVLYGKKELLEAMPPYQGGGDMVDTVTFENTTYAPLPLKFEAGTPPIAAVIALGAAIDFLESIGMEKIMAYESMLLDCLYNELMAVPGITIFGGKKGRTSLVTFTIEGMHPLDLATLLDLQGIAIRSGSLCAQPTLRHFGCTTASRASIALYNTQEEITLFSKALRNIKL